MKRLVHLLVFPCFLLLTWAIVAELKIFPQFLLPSPVEVGKSFVQLLSTGQLQDNILASSFRAIGGFAVAALVAIPTAYCFYHWPVCESQSRLILEALRFIPPLSLIPLLILWLGIGEPAKFAIVILASFFPIYLNVLSGFKQIDMRYGELSKVMNLTRWENFRHIELPASLPSILTGLRLGFGYSWRALVGAELIAAASGLGYLIGEASEMSRTDQVFVGIICIAVLGITGDVLFQIAIKRMVPWFERGKK